MDHAVNKEQKTLTDQLRIAFKGFADVGARFLLRIGLKPNNVTMLGLVGHVAAAYLVATGHITWGGLLTLVMAPFDFLDGTMARMRGESSRFGAFVDSVTDRYSEFVIFGGLLIYFMRSQNWLAVVLIYLAAAGSVLVSYTRARGESLGFTVKVGILTRVERYIVLIPGLIFNIPLISLWIIAILANYTALQRIFFVRQEAYQQANHSSNSK